MADAIENISLDWGVTVTPARSPLRQRDGVARAKRKWRRALAARQQRWHAFCVEAGKSKRHLEAGDAIDQARTRNETRRAHERNLVEHALDPER
jgi:hypothetical protein